MILKNAANNTRQLKNILAEFNFGRLNVSVQAMQENETTSRRIVAAIADEQRDNLRWESLRRKYLPFETGNSIWRYSRRSKAGEPSQGWKLHVSATVPGACDVFEKAAPFLFAQDIQFKAPNSLNELSKINSGRHYGYSQIGKFITVYPATTEQAIYLAEKLHELTAGFVSPSVPFDERYLPDSCVFYRYGSFRSVETANSNGKSESFIKGSRGELVRDDRSQSVPAWLPNPLAKSVERLRFETSPLNTEYQVIRALTQRGKGGVYQAVDLTRNTARFCIIKEGRRNGEADWSGLDGFRLVENEHRVLTELRNVCRDVPEVFSAFETGGNYYLAMEFVEGRSLYDLMRFRRRRFSVEKTVEFARLTAGIIEEIHRAGWVWNDCKPANLIFTSEGNLRPIDFEGAHAVGEPNSFNWKTPEFSRRSAQFQEDYDETGADLYALGAVTYYLLTGKFYERENPAAIEKLRRNVPTQLREIVANLIRADGTKQSAAEVKDELEGILQNLKNSN